MLLRSTVLVWRVSVDGVCPFQGICPSNANFWVQRGVSTTMASLESQHLAQRGLQLEGWSSLVVDDARVQRVLAVSPGLGMSSGAEFAQWWHAARRVVAPPPEALCPVCQSLHPVGTVFASILMPETGYERQEFRFGCPVDGGQLLLVRPAPAGLSSFVDPQQLADLYAAVATAQELWLGGADFGAIFGQVLPAMLNALSCEYGYIALVRRDEAGAPFLQTVALSNIAWNDESRALYEQHAGVGMQFRNLDTLFGWGLRHPGELVMSNSVESDKRARGTPHGHPPLRVYLGLPLMSDGVMVGQIGLGNRPGGFDLSLAEQLRPLASACAQLIASGELAHRAEAQRQELATRSVWNDLLVQHADEGILVEDADGAIALANETFCQIFNLPVTPDMLVGANCQTAALQASVLFRDPELFLTSTAAILEARRHVANEVLETADGRFLERAYVPFADPDGGAAGLWRYRDVTDHVRDAQSLRASEARYATLFQEATDAVFLLDAMGQVSDMNRRALELLDLTPDEVLGRDICALFIIGEPPVSRFEDVPDVHRLEGPILCAGRPQRPFSGEANLTEMHVLGRKMWQVVVHDVSAEADMRHALLRAKREAEAASRAKSNFLAVMSHEIRTPLNAILGMTEILSSTTLTPDQRHLLRTVQTSSDALHTLVSNILDLSKIEAGQMDLEQQPFDVEQLVESVAETMSARVDSRGVEVTCEVSELVPPQVVGDAQRLRQVLVNIAGNSAKFTEHGFIRLSVRVSGQSHDRVRLDFEIDDTGVGIPANQLSNVLRPFQQADGSTARRFGGTGLGLSIARSLVELMGGTLELSSIEGRGTTVAWRLELRSSSTPQISAASHHPPTRGKALIVCHRTVSGRSLESALRAHGWEVELLREADAALGKLMSGVRPDLLFVHEELPDAGASSLVHAVRALPDRRPVTVVTLTVPQPAQHADEEKSTPARLGLPFRRADLRRILANAIQHQREITTPIRPQVTTSSFLAADSVGRILIVDDSPENAEIMRRMIAAPNVSTVTASNGLQAVELRRHEAWSMILMDVEMPEMDGIEATRRIRAWELETGHARCPILVITAHAVSDVRLDAYRAGADGHLTKPVRRDHLRAVVGLWASRKRWVVLDGLDETARETARALTDSSGLKLVFSDSKEDALMLAALNPTAALVVRARTLRDVQTGRMDSGVRLVGWAETDGEAPSAAPGVMTVHGSLRDWLPALLNELESDPRVGTVRDDVPDESVADLVPGFLSTATAHATSMEALVANGQWDAVRRMAHSMRGTSAMLGMRRLSGVLLRLEALAQKEDADGALRVVRMVGTYATRLAEEHQTRGEPT